MSFLVKHSWTAEEDETMTKQREPNQREKMGPCFLERWWNVLWTGSFRRWKWPRIGSEGGLGGKLPRRRFVWSRVGIYK